MRTFLLISALIAALHGAAYAAGMDVLNPSVRQGEAVIVRFYEAPSEVFFDGVRAPVFPYRESWRTAVPVPISAKTGKHKLVAEFAGRRSAARAVSVLKKPSKTIVVVPPPQLGMTPKEITENRDATNKTVRKAVDEIRNETLFSEPFELPLSGKRKISTFFGDVIKVGRGMAFHLGTDFDAPKGSAVAAINSGAVKSAYFDPVYGNFVVVDHGRGIYSLYLHLNEIRVKAGDAVTKGMLIGTVGDSGLASAPHLHLSVKINGVSVDPVKFINTFK